MVYLSLLINILMFL